MCSAQRARPKRAIPLYWPAASEGYKRQTHDGVALTQQACVAEGEQEAALTVVSGAALLLGCRPHFCLYGQMRSVRFRYGIPASRPAPATEAVKTADNKKEGDHE